MLQLLDSSPPATHYETDNLVVRLNTTIRVRWLAIIGQSIAVMFVSQVLGFEMLLVPCLAVIALSAWLNIFLSLRYPKNERWRGYALTGLLSYDIIQLATLLYLTGGIQNPFSILLIVPVVVSAATQRSRFTLLLFCLTLFLATLLVTFHQPLPWFEPAGLVLPLELKAGIWVAIACTMAFTSVYSFSVADESRKLAEALAVTELALEREQHVSNLDGLAAAAAHELGTPLATITLVVKELLRESENTSPQHEDLLLLKSQSERCRQILRTISSLSSAQDENITTMSIPVLMEEIAEPHRHLGKEIKISKEGKPPAPVFRRNASIVYGLGNLLENAVDFAHRQVEFQARWNDEEIRFLISDDGDGFSSSMLEKIGEPFFSQRTEDTMDSGGGLGLGLFIAKTLLERNGASLTIGNKDDGNGARVSILWERQDFDRIL